MGTTLARDSRSPKVGSKAGLVLPPQLVESSYEALAESNCIPRKWHPEGRYGIRIERIQHGEHQGQRFIPLLPGSEQHFPEEILRLLSSRQAQVVEDSKETSSAWMEWTRRQKPQRPTLSPRTAAIPAALAPLAPEAPADDVKRFRFAELFAGLGGFRVALEALGGECVLASEIERFTRQVYELNFGGPVLGDIRQVKDEDVPEVDLLVAGFPCQPFSALGSQPGFEDERGLLFLEIVRILKASRAKYFLLENVPGLLECDGGRALRAIKDELRQAGYEVQVETANARNLTAQSRKRVFFFGAQEGLGLAERPYIPELHLRAGDILEDVEELERRKPTYTLSEEHFASLRQSQKWARRGGMTDTLIWEEKVCNTLVAHYGTSLGKGNSQLVPRPAPFHPRRLTVRECARLMGFPDTYKLTEMGEHPHMWYRALYKMFGNAVCPPLIAVLAASLLGRDGAPTALRLALGAVAPRRREAVAAQLHPSWRQLGEP